MGGERGRGVHEGGIYIYTHIIMTDMRDLWPIPPPHYKAIFLQFNNKKEKL